MCFFKSEKMENNNFSINVQELADEKLVTKDFLHLQELCIYRLNINTPQTNFSIVNVLREISRVVNVIVIDNFPIVHPDDLVQIVINHRDLNNAIVTNFMRRFELTEEVILKEF